MNKITRKLVELIMAHPDVEVLPMVGEDAVCPDYGYTLACLDSVRVDEVLYGKCYGAAELPESRVFFRESDEDEVCELVWNQPDMQSKSESEITELVGRLPWTKCIVMSISGT